MNCDVLKKGMDELELSATDEICAGFGVYYELLEERNKVMNLTAISGEEDVTRLHFLDSLAVAAISDLNGKKIIDVGSGAGFPGLPLKIVFPDISLTMLDAQAKRVGFLDEVCRAAGLTGAEAVHMRAEEAAREKNMRDSFDAALSRAVARLNVLCELCMPFVKPGGVFIAMKSTDTEDEINEAKSAVKLLGGAIEDVRDYTVPTTDIIHRAVIIRKLRSTPKEYPRRFAKISKSPL